MYYNKILRIWVVDQFDYFLLSVILGNIIGSSLKNHLSETKAMERLKNSIIKKSQVLIKSDRPIPNLKQRKIQKIYKFALGNRGGQQFENFQIDHEFSNESFKLAQEIKGLVERLASFLKERELKGIAKIFFKNGRLFLDLILYNCQIGITYSELTGQLNTQVIVITATVGGATGFMVAWFSAGLSLLVPPLLTSILLMRSIGQQIVNQRDFEKFKKLVNQMLENDELKQTLRAIFMEEEVATTTGIEMKPWDSDKNPLPEFNFDSDQTFNEFTRTRIQEELGLVENSTPEQLGEMIPNKNIRKKGKTVYFKDFIKKINEDPDNIIDVQTVKEAIKDKVKNE